MIGILYWLHPNDNQPYKSKRILDDEIPHKLRMEKVLKDAFAKLEANIMANKEQKEKEIDEMNSKYIEQGWQCPVCKAVMSPRERMCVNCRGINLYGTTTTFPETSQYVDVNEFHNQQAKEKTK